MSVVDLPKLIERFRALPAPSPAESLLLEPGTLADYRALAAFHYRSHHAGAATSVLRLVHRMRTIVGRYLARRSDEQLAGVLVRSLPHLSCELRNHATRGRYIGLPQREQAVLLNREMRTISRVVIHPQWRGLGLAVRLVKHALDHPEPGARFTEALAVMGRVNPFFEKAGMVRYERPLHPPAARLLDAIERLGLDVALLASPRRFRCALHEQDEPDQVWFEHELARWYRASGSRARCRPREEPPLEKMLITARDRLLSRPVYYLFAHRDESLYHGGPPRTTEKEEAQSD